MIPVLTFTGCDVAVVGAGFASAVAEQTLTSLGGGGFLLGYSAKQGQSLFFDFLYIRIF